MSQESYEHLCEINGELLRENAELRADRDKLRTTIKLMRRAMAALSKQADVIMKSLKVNTAFLVDENLVEVLCMRIDELELSVRSENCCRNRGITHLYQVVEKSEGDLLLIKNFGRRGIKDIKEVLVVLADTHGLQSVLHIGMEMPLLLRQTVELRIVG